MEKMKEYMVFHYDPYLDHEIVQASWRKLARVEEATWVRTYLNWEKGIRYCFCYSSRPHTNLR